MSNTNYQKWIYNIHNMVNDSIYKDKLSFKTVIKQGHEIKFRDFIWFDIVPVSTPSTTYKRFEYKYTKYDKILDGLKEFYNVNKFTTTKKNKKKCF